MIAEAIEKIISLKRPTSIESDGREYSTVKIEGIKRPLADTLRVHTLSGLAQWCDDNVSGLAGAVVHVNHPGLACVFGPLETDWRRRERFLECVLFEYTPFRFGQFMPLETAIIELQSKFVSTDALRNLINSLSAIRGEVIVTAEDDGAAQIVTVKDAIGRLADARMDPIVTLAPFRTFREIEQPESRFLLRLRKAENLFSVALFEADGGAWQNDAIDRIATHLEKSIDITVIA